MANSLMPRPSCPPLDLGLGLGLSLGLGPGHETRLKHCCDVHVLPTSLIPVQLLNSQSTLVRYDMVTEIVSLACTGLCAE